jgi:hypothetical protein
METTTFWIRQAPAVRVADLMPAGESLPWYLLGRAQAHRVGGELTEILGATEPGTVLPVDLVDVETRASCVAIFLGEPLRRIQASDASPELPDRYLVLEGPLGSNERDVRLGLEDEGLIAVVRDPDGPRLIGKVDRVVEDTYALLTAHREVTSSLLTEPPLSLKLTTANARITKLHRLGLLHLLREEVVESGGRRFVYQVVR